MGETWGQSATSSSVRRVSVWRDLGKKLGSCIHLVAKHTDGAGRRDLAGAEPDGSQARRDAQDEDLRHGDQRLAHESHCEHVRRRRRHLDPRPARRAQRPQYGAHTESLEMKNTLENCDSGPPKPRGGSCRRHVDNFLSGIFRLVQA